LAKERLIKLKITKVL